MSKLIDIWLWLFPSKGMRRWHRELAEYEQWKKNRADYRKG